jgi:hypothetical protein
MEPRHWLLAIAGNRPESFKISGWALGIVIAVLNAFLLWQTFFGSTLK